MNDDQHRAVTAPVSRPLCVLAGPGSGKTYTIIERIVHIHSLSSSSQKSCLALTFSKSAVAEMQQRLKERSQTPLADVMTFHSLGYKVLSMHWRKAGFTSRPKQISDSAAKKLLQVIQTCDICDVYRHKYRCSQAPVIEYFSSQLFTSLFSSPGVDGEVVLLQ